MIVLFRMLWLVAVGIELGDGHEILNSVTDAMCGKQGEDAEPEPEPAVIDARDCHHHAC